MSNNIYERYIFAMLLVPKFSNINSKNVAHKFYGLEFNNSLMSQIHITNSLDDNGDIVVVFHLEDSYNTEIMFRQTETSLEYISGDEFIYNDETFHMYYDKDSQNNSLIIKDTDNNCIQLGIKLILRYEYLRVKLPYIESDNNIKLLSMNTDSITFEYNSLKLVYQRSENKFSTEYDTVNIVNNSDYMTVSISDRTDTTFQMMLQEAYNGTFNSNKVTFNLDNAASHTIDLQDLSNLDSTLCINSVDIRSPSVEHKVGDIVGSKEYTLVKQQWDSTEETENFWWINSTHILALQKNKLAYRSKSDKLDDWNGDRFYTVYEKNRTDIITSDTLYYFVPNVFGCSVYAPFITLSIDDKKILCKVYNVHKAFEEIFEFSISVNRVALGKKLNSGTFNSSVAIFNTYSYSSCETIMSMAEWSSTLIDDRLIIGCHLNNNFDQWTIVINFNTGKILQIIQGYGYVGLKGDLTGGMLPSKYFSLNATGFSGFNNIVKELSSIFNNTSNTLLDNYTELTSVNSVNDFTECVVGTAEQQWYIVKQLSNIVSHITYNQDTKKFSINNIPLTNNYSAIYKSPSFYSSVLGDLMTQNISLSDLFCYFTGLTSLQLNRSSNSNNGDCGSILADAFEAFKLNNGKKSKLSKGTSISGNIPQHMFLAPRYAQLAYVQQTFGQYAYVHYNSSKNVLDDVDTSNLQRKNKTKTELEVNEKQQEQTSDRKSVV